MASTYKLPVTRQRIYELSYHHGAKLSIRRASPHSFWSALEQQVVVYNRSQVLVLVPRTHSLKCVLSPSHLPLLFFHYSRSPGYISEKPRWHYVFLSWAYRCDCNNYSRAINAPAPLATRNYDWQKENEKRTRQTTFIEWSQASCIVATRKYRAVVATLFSTGLLQLKET